MILGWGLAQAQENSTQRFSDAGGVDRVPETYQLGQQLYRQTCGSCHVALPPAVMPTETWRQLLLSNEHYGQQIQLPGAIETRLIWNYVQTFSRPLLENEIVPYRLAQSRYLKALHPDVELPQPTRLGSCATCHPSVDQYNFRRLNAEVSSEVSSEDSSES